MLIKIIILLIVSARTCGLETREVYKNVKDASALPLQPKSTEVVANCS